MIIYSVNFDVGKLNRSKTKRNSVTATSTFTAKITGIFSGSQKDFRRLSAKKFLWSVHAMTGK